MRLFSTAMQYNGFSNAIVFNFDYKHRFSIAMSVAISTGV